MTDSYAIWKPEHDGHAPPNWREGMKVAADGLSWTVSSRGWGPGWWAGQEYKVPAEALNSPNDDAVKDYNSALIEKAVKSLRQYPAEELAKHGIMLVPEKDVFVELLEDVRKEWELWGDYRAKELLRTRFEQMKGEGR